MKKMKNLREENRGEMKRDACSGTKSKATERSTDSAGSSILQRTTEFLKRSLFDQSCCNKYIVSKEKYCGSEHFKKEPQSFHPCMSSGSARSYKPCMHSCELVPSKPTPITAPSPLLYQRPDELCNKDICRSKYPCLDDPDFVKNSECPHCPTTMPSRYSTTPHFRTNEFPGKYSYSGYPSGKESTDMFQPQVVPMYSTAGPPIYLRHEGLPPKYGGHVPGKDFSYGKTFGRATTDAKQCLVEECS